MSGKSFHSSAGFGKQIESLIVGQMLSEGLAVYLPVVDDHGVDALILRSGGSSVALVQIKARSEHVAPGDAAFFAAIDHPKERKDYWFVFYSERMKERWIMTSREFINSSNRHKTGKNAGKRSIRLNGIRHDKATGQYREHALPRFETYRKRDFSHFRNGI